MYIAPVSSYLLTGACMNNFDKSNIDVIKSGVPSSMRTLARGTFYSIKLYIISLIYLERGLYMENKLLSLYLISNYKCFPEC